MQIYYYSLDFNNSIGNSELNHPVSISSNGEKLAVTDRFNNRVLYLEYCPNRKNFMIYESCIGQQNFTTHEWLIMVPGSVGSSVQLLLLELSLSF